MKCTPGSHLQRQPSGLMTEPPRAGKKREEKAPSSGCRCLREAVLGAGGGTVRAAGRQGTAACVVSPSAGAWAWPPRQPLADSTPHATARRNLVGITLVYSSKKPWQLQSVHLCPFL